MTTRKQPVGRLGDWLLGGWTVLIFLFLFAPLVVIVIFSFNDAELSILPMRGLTFRWYTALLEDEQLRQALGNSLIVAGCVVALAPALGTLAAVGIHRYTVRLKVVVSSLVMLPMMTPRLILGIALLNTYTFFNVGLSLKTVIAGHVVIAVPYVVLIVSARLLGFDRHLEEAARDLGASTWVVFKEITAPLLRPAIIGGALISFTVSFDDVVVAFFNTGTDNTLPMYIWAMLRYGINPKLNALAAATLVTSMGVALAAELLIRRSGVEVPRAAA